MATASRSRSRSRSRQRTTRRATSLDRRIRRRSATPLTGPVAIRCIPLDDEGRAALGARIAELDADLGADAPPQAGPAAMRPNPFSDRGSRARVLAIASGKGGVGKSSVTVSLAVTLARLGYRVGLLDADIYGFSVPRMLEVGYPPLVLGRVIVPPVAHGVRAISMGFFADEETAVAWRGPMLHKALEQFLVDVHWGTLDFLVVDMPPGTGDVPISVGQQLPRAEMYIVTTPQLGATRVAQRAGALAKQLRHPVRGVIENMSWFTAPNGQRYALFGAGGGARLAESLAGSAARRRSRSCPMVGEGDERRRSACGLRPRWRGVGSIPRDRHRDRRVRSATRLPLRALDLLSTWVMGRKVCCRRTCPSSGHHPGWQTARSVRFGQSGLPNRCGFPPRDPDLVRTVSARSGPGTSTISSSGRLVTGAEVAQGGTRWARSRSKGVHRAFGKPERCLISPS